MSYRNVPVPNVSADLVARLRVATGERIVDCARALDMLPERERIAFVEQVERGEKCIGPPGPK